MGETGGIHRCACMGTGEGWGGQGDKWMNRCGGQVHGCYVTSGGTAVFSHKIVNYII